MITSLLKSFFTLAVAEVLSKLIVFAAFAYMARLLGPSNFGVIEWSVAVLMCAGMIVEQGLSSFGAREIAKEPGATARLIRQIVFLRFGLAALSYLLVAVLALSYVHDAKVTRLILIYGISLWMMPASLIWVFQGHKQMGLVAFMQAARYSVFALIVFLFVRTSNDLEMVAWAEVAAVGSSAAISMFLYRTGLAAEPMVADKRSFSGVIREAFPIGLSQVLWVLKYFGATLIVGFFATSEETGYFGASMRLLVALHTFVWLYFFNMLPTLAGSWKDSQSEFSKLISRSLQLVVPASALVAIVWIAGANTAIRLAFGSDFSGAAPILQWLCGVWVAAAISGHYRFGLIASGYQRQEMYTAALGAITAGLLVVLGYYTYGTAGSAAGLFAAEVLVLIASWAYARRLLFSANRHSFSFQERLLSDATGNAK